MKILSKYTEYNVRAILITNFFGSLISLTKNRYGYFFEYINHR